MFDVWDVTFGTVKWTLVNGHPAKSHFHCTKSMISHHRPEDKCTNVVLYGLLLGASQTRSTTYVNAVCCYRPSSVVCRSVDLSVCLSVCRSVTLVSPAKTAKPIEMPFGLRTRVGPGNHVLDGVHNGVPCEYV